VGGDADGELGVDPQAAQSTATITYERQRLMDRMYTAA